MRCATRNSKWKWINKPKGKPSAGKEENWRKQKGRFLSISLWCSPVRSKGTLWSRVSTLLQLKLFREVLREKLVKKPRNKNKQINKQEQINDKPREKSHQHGTHAGNGEVRHALLGKASTVQSSSNVRAMYSDLISDTNQATKEETVGKKWKWIVVH